MSHGNQNSPGQRVSDNMLALATELGYDCHLSERDIQTIHSRYKSEGNSFLMLELPKLAKAMCMGVTSGCFVLPVGFKPWKKGSCLPAFLHELFLCIFNKDGTYRDCLSGAQSYEDIYQFCSFFYKMKMPFTDSMVSSFSDSFIHTDGSIRVEPYGLSDRVINRASDIITSVLAGFDPTTIICKDGPGVVSNGTLISKTTKRLDSFPITRAEYLPHFFLSSQAMLDEQDRWPKGEELVPTSKVIFVQKDARGPRVISAEPRENQFVQQGIRQFMYSAIESHPLTSGQIHFTEQQHHGALALYTSLVREYATIDLKEASDRVSLTLVERLFSGLPLLKRYILDSRSTRARLPDGREVELRKFAPMGSALCFPVMALVIFSLIRAEMELRDSTMDILLGVHPDKRVLVYGDDIIVSADHAYLAMDVLERYGMMINNQKSYVGSPFAESCGVDAYWGIDITPVRLRVSLDSLVGPWRFPNGKIRPRMLSEDGLSLVETINQLDTKRRFRAARFLLGRFENTFGHLPIGHSFSGAPCLLKGGRIAQEISECKKARRPRYWSIRPISEVNEDESGWSHLMRTIHSLGNNSVIPLFGEYTLPKQYKIVPATKPRWFDSDYASSDWLPKGCRQNETIGSSHSEMLIL